MQQFGLLAWIGNRRKVIILVTLTVVGYFAAINRTQAFLWVIPALLSATLITGFFWPRWLVKKLTVSRSGPARAEEGETIHFRIEVENQGMLPRFMVEIVDHLPFVGLSDANATSLKTLGMVAYLPGNQRQQFEVPVICEKRGYYRLGPVGLASSFPLGLTEARASRNEGRQSLTIYPDVFQIMSLPLKGAPSQIHRGGYVLPEGAGAAEFSGLREYRRGDNPRHIHWPTTARLSELMVREYEPLASACLYLLLDQAAESNVGLGRESTFEYAVRIAASIGRAAASQNIRTRLAGDGKNALRGVAGAGDLHFQGMLDELAVVACDGSTPYEQLLGEVGPFCLRGETAVVFLSERAASWTKTLEALATLRARQVHLLAVLFDQASFVPDKQASKHESVDLVRGSADLLELGAHVITVRQGDDLVSLFNP
jgi:uncharacterized protein (DUF58 family)